MQVIQAGVRPSTPADPSRYSGEVWTDAVVEGGPPGHVHVARVAFSPAARTARNAHPFGQILLAVCGVGLGRVDGMRKVRVGGFPNRQNIESMGDRQGWEPVDADEDDRGRLDVNGGWVRRGAIPPRRTGPR